MFIPYNADAQERWRSLNQSQAFFVDHVMNSVDEIAPNLLKMRQPSFQDLSELSASAIPGRDRVLMEALREEFTSLAQLFCQVSLQPSSLMDVPIGAEIQSASAQRWLEFMASAQTQEELCYRSSLTFSRLGLNWKSEVLRIFVASLMQISRSEREVRLELAHSLMAEGLFDTSDLVSRIIAKRDEARRYSVEFRVHPSDISRQILNAYFLNPDIEFLLEADPSYDASDPHDRASLLTGFIIQSTAFGPNEALEIASQYARHVLDYLRISCFVETSLKDPIVVRTLDDDFERFHSIRRPFWNPKFQQHRKIPRLSRQLLEKGASRSETRLNWEPALWHIARAVSLWSEDIHSAASSVWQSLESLCGSPAKVQNVATDVYLETLRRDCAELLVRRLGYGSWQLRKNNISDWSIKTNFKKTGDPLDALRQIEIQSRTWRYPERPQFVFDPAMGMASFVFRPQSPISRYFRFRMLLDTRYLEAVRHSVVHRGHRLGSSHWVEYLASLGLEIVLRLSELEADEQTQ